MNLYENIILSIFRILYMNIFSMFYSIKGTVYANNKTGEKTFLHICILLHYTMIIINNYSFFKTLQ